VENVLDLHAESRGADQAFIHGYTFGGEHSTPSTGVRVLFCMALDDVVCFDDVIFLGLPAPAPAPANGNGDGDGAPSTSVASQAKKFTALLTDDSQDEPSDFDVPGDDFGS
jgi:hypothetical protein